MAKKQAAPRSLSALKVHQWLPDWDKVRFDETEHRKRPDPFYYLFTVTASDLKILTGIYRRNTTPGILRSQDLGIQRRHDSARSDEIRDFIHYGYPWSELSKTKRGSKQFDDLRKPGWLPTAIIVNILKPGDIRPDSERKKREVDQADLIVVEDENDKFATIRLPSLYNGPDWEPKHLHPIEVIDGQHRLWAFDKGDLPENFEVPVVAFHGLDISWQAYLFWTINIKPKRINASMAFDLIPLLRTEDWLTRFEGHHIYRETRSQELTEALWSNSQSPWYQRINMLGDPGSETKTVSQAAWTRSLMSTFVKAFEGQGVSIGGLFGAPVGQDKITLPWNRAQQAALLIFIWRELRDAIKECDAAWATSLRDWRSKRSRCQRRKKSQAQDAAFAGPHSLLSTDQGVRGVLYVSNDICSLLAVDLNLDAWILEKESGAADEEAVAGALKSLPKLALGKLIHRLAGGLARFDWRTSSAPGLPDAEKTAKLVFRGSGGYRELRRQLLNVLKQENGDVSDAAERVSNILGY